MLGPEYDVARGEGEEESQNVRMLRESYSAAKVRAAEFSVTSNLALHLRVHGQQAARVYSALSTLLYASISISKADELERFVKKKASQLPLGVFDIEEWSHVINIAHKSRHGDIKKLQEEYRVYKKWNESRLAKVRNATSGIHKSSSAFKANIKKELLGMERHIKSFSLELVPAIDNKLKTIENEKNAIIDQRDNLEKQLAETKEEVGRLEEARVQDAIAAKLDKEEAIKIQASAHEEEMSALREAHEVENATNRRILEETRAAHEEEKKELQRKRQEADNRVLTLIKSHEDQYRQLMAMHEKTIEDHKLSDAEAAHKHQSSIADLNAKHGAHITSVEERHRANADDLKSQIAMLEKLHQEAIENGKAMVAAEAVRGKEQLSLLDSAHAAKQQDIMNGHQETVHHLKGQIERLEKLHQEALENSKRAVEAEILRGKEQLAAEAQLRNNLEASHKVSTEQMLTKHAADVDDLRQQLAKYEALHREAIDHGKQQLEAEILRGKDLVAAEVQIRRQLEADHAAYVARLEAKHQQDSDTSAENYKREIARLERLHQEAVENGKRQAEAETVRGLGQLAAAEAAYTAKLAKAEENHASAAENFKREIERLQKLHQDAIKTGEKNALFEHNRGKELVAAESIRSKKALLSAEAAHVTTVSQLQDAHKDVLNKLNESHAASILHYQEEVRRLEGLHNDALADNKQQLEAEILRGKDLVAAEVQIRRQLEADHAAYVARLEAKHQQDSDTSAENYKREIARLERLHQEAVENGKRQAEAETVRGLGQLAAAEAAYTAKLAKAEENHASAAENFKREIERLEKLHQDAVDNGRLQLEAEKQRGQMLLDAEVVRGQEKVAASEAAYMVALKTSDDHNREKYAKLDEANSIAVENLKREIMRLEKLHLEAVEFGKRQVAAEIARSREQLAASETAFAAFYAQSIENHAKTLEALQKEIERLEKLHQDALQHTNIAVEAEIVRGKGQLAAAEAAYTAKLAKAEENHAAAAENFKREIERLEKLLQDAVDTGEKNVLFEHNRGKELLTAEAMRSKKALLAAEANHVAAVLKADELLEAQSLAANEALAAANENHSREVARLEKLLSETAATYEERLLDERKRSRALVDAEIARVKERRSEDDAAHALEIRRLEETHASQLQKIELSYVEVVNNLKRENEHLSALHLGAVENGKAQLEAEIQRSKLQLAAQEATNESKLRRADEAHQLTCENLKREIARIEKLREEAVHGGKEEVELERNRSQAQLIAETVREKEMLDRAEAQHAAQLARAEESFNARLQKVITSSLFSIENTNALPARGNIYVLISLYRRNKYVKRLFRCMCKKSNGWSNC